tara:strand:- start:41 stop:460 length:420 start_codon:yes stop_codon:yes gene_type:complete
MKRVKGFTLIESLVALVILSLVFASVWGWFSGAITSTERIEKAVATPYIFDQFTARLKTEPLHEVSQGEYIIDDFKLIWQATPERESLKAPYVRQPYWSVTLYTVSVQIYEGRERVTEFTTKQYYQWQHRQAPSLDDMP